MRKPPGTHHISILGKNDVDDILLREEEKYETKKQKDQKQGKKAQKYIFYC